MKDPVDKRKDSNADTLGPIILAVFVVIVFIGGVFGMFMNMN